MENLVSIRGLGTLSLYLLCCLSFGALAGAKAVLSGPSHAAAGDIVTLQGQHFSAGESYSIKTIMGKKTSQQLVTADESGSLSFQLVTGSAGQYQLQVRDSRKRLVATSAVLVRPAGD